MLFETGSEKNLDIEIQNEIDLNLQYTGEKFPSGLRSPSDVSNDFRSDSNSRLRVFEDVPMSLNSQERNLNIDDLRNFHKKDKGDRVVEVRNKMSLQDNKLGENRRLTLKETHNSSNNSISKFKKNYSNAHLSKKNDPKKEDFLDPKFDSAIPKITRMIQAGAGNAQGSESLEFLLTSNADRPKPKMLDVKELTNDMDMIINGIDSLILTRGGNTLKSKLSENPNNFEYSKTNFPKTGNFQLTKILETKTPFGQQKEVTNLVKEDSIKEFKKPELDDEELKKIKEELNLKADTQDMREYLSQELSTSVGESHPFLSNEKERAELRRSLEKYAANLERIEEEEGGQTKESSYMKERALKQNEDTFYQAFDFDITKESLKKSIKPPIKM